MKIADLKIGDSFQNAYDNWTVIIGINIRKKYFYLESEYGTKWNVRFENFKERVKNGNYKNYQPTGKHNKELMYEIY